MRSKIYIFLFAGLLFCVGIHAQNVAVKTNLLGWTTASPNLGLEVGLGKKTTLNLSGSVNPFRFGEGRQWKHWLAQPEFRYWFCERFHGHFLGLHALGGEYNIAKVKTPFGLYPGLEDTRYQGWGIGAGIAYGYQWLLSKHWSFEATAGVGYVYSEYDRYPCAECGSKLESGRKHYFGPTKAALSLIYMF